MKRYPASLIIREIQVKTTTTLHFRPVRMAKIKNTTKHKYWRGCREKETLVHDWWEFKLVKPLWKTVWKFLEKLKKKKELPYDSTIPLLDIY